MLRRSWGQPERCNGAWDVKCFALWDGLARRDVLVSIWGMFYFRSCRGWRLASLAGDKNIGIHPLRNASSEVDEAQNK